MLWETQIRASL
ncbi:hypothetical protein YPPY46_4353, partial [Yersinia pestis PY-46]